MAIRAQQLQKTGNQPGWIGGCMVWSKNAGRKECNWVQTRPGKGWHMILRLYYPLEPLFNKSWEPGEIEEVKII